LPRESRGARKIRFLPSTASEAERRGPSARRGLENAPSRRVVRRVHPPPDVAGNSAHCPRRPRLGEKALPHPEAGAKATSGGFDQKPGRLPSRKAENLGRKKQAGEPSGACAKAGRNPQRVYAGKTARPHPRRSARPAAHGERSAVQRGTAVGGQRPCAPRQPVPLRAARPRIQLGRHQVQQGGAPLDTRGNPGANFARLRGGPPMRGLASSTRTRRPARARVAAPDQGRWCPAADGRWQNRSARLMRAAFPRSLGATARAGIWRRGRP